MTPPVEKPENRPALIDRSIYRLVQRNWLNWSFGIALLVIISGIAISEINRRNVRRLELAAQQIPVGADWRRVWTADKALWYKPVFCTSTTGSPSEEYVYGGPIGRTTSGMSWKLYESPLTSRWSGWFHSYARYPVSVVVDQGGQGKVIGIRLRDHWRGVRVAPVAQKSAFE